MQNTKTQWVSIQNTSRNNKSDYDQGLTLADLPFPSISGMILITLG